MVAGHRVVVTGATGFVAHELVKELLSRGYDVHGTVRSTKDATKLAVLRKLGEALPGRLTLHEADLLKEGSFDEVVKGARIVFHTASPFLITPEHDAQKELIEPALHGTQNVLRAVLKAKDSVKRVVLTSSVAAVIGKDGPKNGTAYSEEDWNMTANVEDTPYFLSKTLAEREAWKIAKESGLDLVCVNPNFVQGPVLSPCGGGLSIGHLKAWLEGKAGGNPVIVDVRDVVMAHILAAETPSASGRYIVSNTHSTNPREISRILQERFPQFKIPNGEDIPAELKIDNSRAQRELGLRMTPVSQTVIDGAVTLFQLGIAKPLLA